MWEAVPNELFKFYSSLDQELTTMQLPFEKWLQADIIVAVRKNNKVIGISGLRRNKFLPVSFTVVHRDYQGQGIGTLLKKKLNQKAKRTGYKIITLSVLKNNAKAISMNKKLGYKKFLSRNDFNYMVKFLWVNK